MGFILAVCSERDLHRGHQLNAINYLLNQQDSGDKGAGLRDRDIA